MRSKEDNNDVQACRDEEEQEDDQTLQLLVTKGVIPTASDTDKATAAEDATTRHSLGKQHPTAEAQRCDISLDLEHGDAMQGKPRTAPAPATTPTTAPTPLVGAVAVGGPGAESEQMSWSPSQVGAGFANNDPTTSLQGGTVVLGATLVADVTEQARIDDDEEQCQNNENPGIDNGQSDVILGSVLQEYGSTVTRNRPGWLLILLLGLVGGGTLISVLLLSPGSGQDGTADPEDYTNRQLPPFQDNLHAYYLSRIEDVDSPVYKANLWMWMDPKKDTYSTERQRQRFDMVQFYYGTGGPTHWKHNDHWLSYDISECQWWTSHPSPDEVCTSDGFLLVRNYSSNNLQSSHIPGQWYASFHAHTIDYSNNNISGPLPGQDSPNLTTYVLSNNQFGGQQSGGPPGLLSRYPYKILRLNGNQLQGSYEAVFMLMPHLEEIDLSDNLFVGEPSSYLQFCKNLTRIAFGGNNLSGSLPKELGRGLSKLKDFNASANSQLGGSVPLEWGNGMISLETLDLRGTAVNGSLPPLFCTREAEGLLKIYADCSLVDCCSNST